MQASRAVERHQQLFDARQYAACAAACAEALAVDPECLALRILRARSLMAIRRDEEAKRELSRALRWHRPTGDTYRLLGELAIRGGKLGAARTFLAQAVRLAPQDDSAAALLELVQSSNQPTVAVEKLPAATATVGCTVPAGSHPGVGEPTQRRRLAAGSHFDAPTAVGGAPAAPSAPGDRFGRYLVDIGALTPRQLRAALDYHRRSGVRLGAAAVALGFLSEPSVEWAARDYHIARQPEA